MSNIGSQAAQERERSRRSNGQFGQRVSPESGAKLPGASQSHFHPTEDEGFETVDETVEHFNQHVAALWLHQKHKNRMVDDFEASEKLARKVKAGEVSPSDRREMKRSARTCRGWAKELDASDRDSIREMQRRLKGYQKRGVHNIGGIEGSVQDRLRAGIESVKRGESTAGKLALALRENEQVLRDGAREAKSLRRAQRYEAASREFDREAGPLAHIQRR